MASHSIEQGVGVRAISGEKTGFAYTDEVLLPALHRSLGCRARHRAQRRPQRGQGLAAAAPTHRLYLPVDPLDAMRDEDKVAWLMRIDADTRAHRSAGQASHGHRSPRCTRSS